MNDLIAYTYDFVSYLTLQTFFNKYPIRKIVLFGSSVRHDYNKKSDIDIFIDVSGSKSANLKKQIEKVKNNFINSGRIKKWINLNIKNEFSIIVGNLTDKKWSDMRRSMHSHAVVLWQRYQEEAKDLEPYVLLKWSAGTKDVNKRVNLARKLYGYSQKGKHYEGIFERLGIKPIDDGIAIVPSEHINLFRKLFNELNVKYILKDVFIKK